jgi:hypothetical protein
MMIGLYSLSGIFAATGITSWVCGYRMKEAQRRENKRSIRRMSEDRNTLRDQFAALRREYPQLPSIPLGDMEYDGWIEEVLKRVRMRAWGLTREREMKLMSQLTALQQTKLNYVETMRKLHQAQRDTQRDVERADRRRQHEDLLEDRRYAAEDVRLELEIEELQDKLRQLREEKKRPSAAPDPIEEVIAGIRRKIKTEAGIKAAFTELEQQYPDLKEWLRRECRKIISDLREQ